MGIYTYLNENERQTWSQVHDIELNELFQEIRQKVSDKYLLQMHLHYRKDGWFSKRKTFYSYSMYVDLGHEAKVMNLPANTERSSIGTMLSKETVMTYFYGLLNGFHFSSESSQALDISKIVK